MYRAAGVSQSRTKTRNYVIIKTQKNKMEFVASAPGKIILFGEHSVVYPGRSAIATCVSELRVKVGVVRSVRHSTFIERVNTFSKTETSGQERN